MKNLVFIFFLVLIVSSCKDDITKNPILEFEKETDFKLGNIYSNNDLSIQLDSVTSDSRCPSDAICVWEGNASVKFFVTFSGTKHSINLNTNGGRTFPMDTTLQQYIITLTNLAPYPKTTSTIAQKDYEATLIIEVLEN